MKYLNEKLKIVFLPFLVMNAALLAAYTFLHWLLFIQFHVFPVKDEILDVILPIALPWLPILLWFRKRTRIIQEKGAKGKGDPRLGMQFVIWLAMAAPLIVSQVYLETASGKLTALDDISHLKEYPATKYYTLKHVYFDKAKPLVHGSTSVSGKNNQYLDFHFHILLPVYVDSNQIDSTKMVLAWFGKKYYKETSNRGSDAEKDKQWDQFAHECQEDFDTANFQNFSYLENEGLSEDRDRYLKALEKKAGAFGKDVIILTAKNEPFEQRNGDTLQWILGLFALGAMAVFLVLLLVRVDEDQLEKYKIGHVETNDDAKEFFSFFIPNKLHFITPVIIDLNILVFLLMVFSGMGLVSFATTDLIKLGANFGPLTKDGQWWRLFTCMFLHGGIMHVLANMYGLLFVGIILEPIIGRIRFAVAYIITGLLASTSSLLWYQATASVGASGAIFGMYGVFLALLLLKVFPKEVGKPFLLSTSIFVGYNLLMGLAGAGIDNAAHIGGLVSGLIVGMIFYPSVKKQMDEKALEAPTDENV